MATKKPVTPAKTGTAVAVKKASAGGLVDIKAQMAAEVALLASRVGAPGGDAIKVTQDKKFELPDGTKHTELRLVIGGFVSANSFYEGAYDKDNISPPACFSIGISPTTLVPSDNSPLKQADSCTACPMNQFGTAGNGKACKNGRVLAVLPPDADADTPLAILKVSPTALKAFDAYVTTIARNFQMPPVGVSTLVTFDDNVTYASLRFGEPEPNDNLAVHFGRKAEAMERLMTEPDVSQFQAAPPPKKAAMPARRK
jgi:hypothetical protein